MKTTLESPDDLMRRIKLRAAHRYRKRWKATGPRMPALFALDPDRRSEAILVVEFSNILATYRR